MKNDYLIIIGDCDKFIEDCKIPYSNLIRLVSLKDSIEKATDGKCHTIDELFGKEQAVSIQLFGLFKDDQQFFDRFNKTVSEFIIEDSGAEEDGLTFRVYRIGDELKHIYLRNKTYIDVMEAKRIGFPNRYMETEAPLLLRDGSIEKKSSGIMNELNSSIYRKAWNLVFLNDREEYDVPHLNWSNTIVFETFDRKPVPIDKFKIFKKRDFELKLVEDKKPDDD